MQFCSYLIVWTRVCMNVCLGKYFIPGSTHENVQLYPSDRKRGKGKQNLNCHTYSLFTLDRKICSSRHFFSISLLYFWKFCMLAIEEQPIDVCIHIYLHLSRWNCVLIYIKGKSRQKLCNWVLYWFIQHSIVVSARISRINYLKAKASINIDNLETCNQEIDFVNYVYSDRVLIVRVVEELSEKPLW